MDLNEQMQFIYDFFEPSLPRLGPGNDIFTKRALDMLLSAKPDLLDTSNAAKLKILDIGCGNGAQTIQLAKLIGGTILAVDKHQPFLDELQRRAETEGVSDRIQTYLKDMSDSGLPDASFDIIWSEGALAICMGFNEGLAACHTLLVPGGLMAVSELTWLRPDPPLECLEFFASVYPEMTDVDTNLANIVNAGFRVIDHFILPESVWWETYFYPVEKRLRSFREEYATNPVWLEMSGAIDMEIEMYRKYSSYYGYVYFIMQRNQT